jgi:hypothetical protein
MKAQKGAPGNRATRQDFSEKQGPAGDPAGDKVTILNWRGLIMSCTHDSDDATARVVIRCTLASGRWLQHPM